MLGSSLGAIFAGPVTVFCSSLFSFHLFPLSSERWQHSLYLLTFFLVLCGIITILSFNLLYKELKKTASVPEPLQKTSSKTSFSRKLLSLSSSLQYLLKSPYLCALLLIVVAEYVSYALGELIFLETLKELYPAPSDYCKFMGNLTLWTGILTGISALLFTPYILQTYSWGKAALITPILMVIMTFAFFFTVQCGKIGILPGSSPLHFAVMLGSLHFAIGRSAKYTLFDATKELAFIPLSQEAQIKGKLIIDGIGSRLGRGTSSFLSILLFLILGSPGESALFAGILAFAFALISIPASRSIGAQFEKINTAQNLSSS
jgi:AAA family ATP:ADP antiporter